MGYITRFDGELTISPPLDWAEIRTSRFGPDQFADNRKDVKVRVEESTVNTAEGQMIRRAGVALVPAYEDEMRGYGIVDHVQEFIDECAGRHTVSGRFDCEGEQAGDLWRLEIHDGRAVKVTPRIVWPDGSETEAR